MEALLLPLFPLFCVELELHFSINSQIGILVQEPLHIKIYRGAYYRGFGQYALFAMSKDSGRAH